MILIMEALTRVMFLGKCVSLVCTIFFIMQTNKFDGSSRVADIVAMDHRTADVFRKHGITYCCGGKYPLEMACKMHNLNEAEVQSELVEAMRTLSLPNTTDFKKWDANFLVDYLLNVHHHYLNKTLPE